MATTNQTIADNVRFARQQMRLSQVALAGKLQFASHSAVSDMEAGKRRISATDLVQLSEILEKPVDWFLDPDATREDFVVLARAESPSPKLKAALAEAEGYFMNYLLLRRLLKR